RKSPRRKPFRRLVSWVPSRGHRVDKQGRKPYHPRSAAPGRMRTRGGVAEWLKAADCKSADERLRRFESYPLHQRFATGRLNGAAPDRGTRRSVLAHSGLVVKVRR